MKMLNFTPDILALSNKLRSFHLLSSVIVVCLLVTLENITRQSFFYCFGWLSPSKMGIIKYEMCVVQFLIFELILNLDKKGSKFLEIRVQPSGRAQNDLNNSESQIRRSQNLLQLEQRVLEHRGRILGAQSEIVEVRKSLKEIRERLTELSD